LTVDEHGALQALRAQVGPHLVEKRCDRLLSHDESDIRVAQERREAFARSSGESGTTTAPTFALPSTLQQLERVGEERRDFVAFGDA